MLLHILTKTKKDYDKDIHYIRVLGFNDNGKKILKEVKNNINMPIITKYKKEHDYLFKDDINANKLYSLLTNYDVSNEYQSAINKTSLK